MMKFHFRDLKIKRIEYKILFELNNKYYYNGFEGNKDELLIYLLEFLKPEKAIKEWLKINSNIESEVNLRIVLYYAAINNHLEILKYLIFIGADMEDDFIKEHLLNQSANAGCLKTVKFLISIGADVHNDICQLALRLSFENDHTEIHNYLKEVIKCKKK